MSATTTETKIVSATTRWLRGLWKYYREYTNTAIHAASAAALTAFGLLIFINRLFVVLAIAAYICPPILLYAIDADLGRTASSSAMATVRTDSNSNTDSDTDSDGDDGDTDSDSSDGDSDGDDGDTDSDGNDTDTDTDG